MPNLDRTRAALAAYDEIDASVDTAESWEYDRSMRARDEALTTLLEAFAEDTSDRNERETVISSPMHNGVVMRLIRRLVEAA